MFIFFTFHITQKHFNKSIINIKIIVLTLIKGISVDLITIVLAKTFTQNL